MRASQTFLHDLMALLVAAQILCAAPAIPNGAGSFGKLPLTFEPNQGQGPAEFEFFSRGPGYLMGLSATTSTLLVNGAQIRATLVGGKAAVTGTGEQATGGVVHYFTGSSREDWRTGIPTFTRVRFRQVYPGVDLVYYGNQRQLEYDFEIAPGADPTGICVEFEGIEHMRVAPNGDLLLRVAGGELRHRKPRVFQSGQELEASYRISRNKQVRIEIAAYDRSKPITVDPVLSYSSFLGGAGDDRVYAIAVDSEDCVYIAGETLSTNFPAANAFQPWSRGYGDAFVTKLDATGSRVLFSTYLGGSNRDEGTGIARDAGGNIYITGFTRSTNFPVTSGAFRTTNAGGEDAFVAKLAPNGANLIYSTYVGGSGNDRGTGIALDSSGSILIAGYTGSVNLPLVSPVQSMYAGDTDAFVAKLNPVMSSLVYSTYLGGSSNDTANGIAVDATGNAYIAGQTQSSNFPARNALQPHKASNGDAFLVKLPPIGGSIAFSTFFGGSGADSAKAVALDSKGDIYITGSTYSIDLPVSSDCYQRAPTGSYDVFVSKINGAGTALLYSTYLGGSGSEEAAAVAVDGSGNAYVTGYTSSVDFPLQSSIVPAFSGAFDAFVAGVNATGSRLLYSTYLGGAGDDRGQAIAVDASGAALMAGYSASTEYPTTPGAYQTAWGGSFDGVVTKINGNLAPIGSVSPAAGSGGIQTFTFTFSDPNGYTDLGSLFVLFNSAVTGSNGCYFNYDRANRQIWLANDTASQWNPVGIGSAATVQNSQCSIDGAASSATASGSNAVLTLQVAFKAAFAGSKNIYMYVSDMGGLNTGWMKAGAWNVVSANSPPSVSVSPASGSGTSQTLTFTFSDPNGYTDLNSEAVMINSALNGANACFFYYSGTTVGLTDDTCTQWSSMSIGSTATLQNSQCSITGTGSSVTQSGTSVVLALPVTFKSAFAGLKTVYMTASDTGGLSTGWKPVGTWNVAGNSAPTVAVSPTSGSGSSRTFTFTFSDPNGYTDLTSELVVINSVLNGSNACYFFYDWASNQIWLSDNRAAQWNPLVIGSTGSVNNSQCTISGVGSSAVRSGSQAAISLPIKFTAAFKGTRNVYMNATDKAGLTTGWKTAGSWVVP